MKRLLLAMILFSAFWQAQDLEEQQEGFFYSENTKNFFRVDIKKPFDYYKVNSCDSGSTFVRAQFDSGDAAFNRELFRYISAYIDREIYVVNGSFFLQIDINKGGKMTNLDINPKVENSEMFLKDLKFAVRKIKKTWIPSTCNNIPVDSKIRIQLNFVTEGSDI